MDVRPRPRGAAPGPRARDGGAISSGVAKDRVPPGSQTSLREANRARVLTVVQQRGSITQVELAGVTGLSAATISNIVKELTVSGVLTTTPSTRSGSPDLSRTRMALLRTQCT